MRSSRHRPSGQARDLGCGRWIAEFLVVFLGVLTAFWFDGWREERRDDQRRDQIVESLRYDIAEGRTTIAQNLDWFDELFEARVLKPLREGEQPQLLPVPLPATVSDDTWSAVLASGGMEVLDVGLVRAVERVLAQIANLGAIAHQYNDYVRTVLVPNLGAPAEEYYQGGGRLHTKYLWYYHSLVGYRGLLADIGAQMAELQTLLDRS